MAKNHALSHVHKRIRIGVLRRISINNAFGCAVMEQKENNHIWACVDDEVCRRRAAKGVKKCVLATRAPPARNNNILSPFLVLPVPQEHNYGPGRKRNRGKRTKRLPALGAQSTKMSKTVHLPSLVDSVTTKKNHTPPIAFSEFSVSTCISVMYERRRSEHSRSRASPVVTHRRGKKHFTRCVGAAPRKRRIACYSTESR